jgi:hypothetical protein
MRNINIMLDFKMKLLALLVVAACVSNAHNYIICRAKLFWP